MLKTLIFQRKIVDLVFDGVNTNEVSGTNDIISVDLHGPVTFKRWIRYF